MNRIMNPGAAVRVAAPHSRGARSAIAAYNCITCAESIEGPSRRLPIIGVAAGTLVAAGILVGRARR